MPLGQKKIYHIYCDESRQCVDRFMVLGGIIIDAEDVKTVNDTMANYRNVHNMRSELKWSKVKNQKIQEYKTFIDYFFALNNTDKVHFKCMVIDNHKVNHKKFNAGDNEKGFYKFYYQLLLNSFGRPYYIEKDNTRFIVHPDERSTKYKLDDLKDIYFYRTPKES
jgi:hypothetical protein